MVYGRSFLTWLHNGSLQDESEYELDLLGLNRGSVWLKQEMHGEHCTHTQSVRVSRMAVKFWGGVPRESFKRYSPLVAITWLWKPVDPDVASCRAMRSLRCIERSIAAVRRSREVAVLGGLSGDSGWSLCINLARNTCRGVEWTHILYESYLASRFNIDSLCCISKRSSLIPSDG